MAASTLSTQAIATAQKEAASPAASWSLLPRTVVAVPLRGSSGNGLRSLASRGGVTCLASHSRSAVLAVSAGQDSFAQAEVEKLLRDLPEILKREAPGGNDAQRAARVVAEALGGFFKDYTGGEISPDIFADVKVKLQAEQFPAPYVEKVLQSAVGWTRSNLFKDWNNWSSK